MTKEIKPKDIKKLEKKIEELEKNIETIEQEKSEIFEKLQRVSADYANYQKRAPKQIADSVTYEKEKIIKSIFPALDNFEHAIQAADSAENVQAVVEGVKIVYDGLVDTLKSHGVEQIASAGQTFDHEIHQAMLQQSDPEKEDGIVLEEYQKGYKLADRVLRPAKVIVNKIQIDQPEQQQQTKPESETDTETQEQ